MRGNVTLLFIWALALSPLLLSLFRVPGRAYLLLCGVLSVVFAGGLAAHLKYGYDIAENLSTSLPGHIYIYRVGEPFTKGDLIAFHWHGGATYPAGTVFIKPVVGVPGDVVRREGRKVWVGDHFVGIAKTHSLAGVPLTPAATGPIAAGNYFVATPNPDSLDSRYALTGNITQAAIIGRAHELF
jgi:conjugal transfer pilin signal peptidase TrbI